MCEHRGEVMLGMRARGWGRWACGNKDSGRGACVRSELVIYEWVKGVWIEVWTRGGCDKGVWVF